ncbi:MAG: GEVED domain-containing protein [Bacteroidota bacterium]
MKKFLMTFGLALSALAIGAQDYWQARTPNTVAEKRLSEQSTPKSFKVYELDTDAFQKALLDAPLRTSNYFGLEKEITFPMADGTLQRFKVIEAPVLDEVLSTQYPDIKSYAGQGIEHPTDLIRFSVSPLGVKAMLISPDKGYEFIEPYSTDLSHYMVYNRQDRNEAESDFECTLKHEAHKKINDDGPVAENADDGILRNYRLVVSTNGEYTAYFGGTVAQALAAINTTMTRVNGIFENDFNITMTLISNTTAVIYTNSSSDPYGNSSGGWNAQLQNTLTSVIGEANYDIGHLFARGGNNGNAGCIGCVCVNGQKGSAFTSRTTPEGDPFDVDYVAHEMGHQFGGNHTWTFGGNEGTNVQMEPGSGSTIMGYAGITGATDVQPNSDPYFHAISIEQITDYAKTTSCQINTSTGNAVPTANAGANYTIPRGTPFTLSGSGSDADGDALTYCWEQIDENNASTTYPSATATSGVAFRSLIPTTSPDRTFPQLSTILAGNTATTWEVIPNVSRTLNFRLTVRDNVAGGAANNSDDMVVTVNGSTGPFVVNSPNTNVNWSAGSSQTVTWSVAGTSGAPINTGTVNILLSIDSGSTFPITLAANTSNDGSQVITVPNNAGTANRIKVEAANNIFFDISNSNFTISGAIVCSATIPSGLSASSVGSNTATLSWSAVSGAANYTIRYRPTGTGSWTTQTVNGTSVALSGLTASTAYEAQVRSVCPDNSTSNYSSSVNFTTTQVQINYCSSNGNNLTDEYISNVTLGSINNPSGASAGGYADFTNLSTDLNKGVANTISITPTWTGTIYNEGYAVWIDYNQDGDFTDAGEQVYSRSPTNTTPVSGSFTVPTSATDGATRMRVSMKYTSIPTPCETFTYGEVEDYTVNVIATAVCDTPTGLATANVTSNSASADWNAVAGAVSYSIRYRATGTSSWTTSNTASTSANFSGLTASTTYEVQVRSNCATLNAAYSSSITFTTAPAQTTYCNSNGNNLSDEYIGNVTLGSINNPSGASAGGYADFTNLSTDLTKGVANTISITPIWTGTIYNEGYAVWIDYNQDGDFTDVGEQVYTRSPTNTTPVSGSFTVPTSATDGATRMRVSMKYNGIPSACETFTYGEVEDYTVNIGATSGCSGGISSFPYTEGFESGLGSWTQGSGDDFNWSRRSGNTPSNNTGPSSAFAGSFYVYTESSNPNYPNRTAIFNSPCFDLSGESSATLSFRYHLYGASNMGNLNLEASNDNGASWSSVWSATGNQGNAWLTANVSLGAYVGGAVQFRFIGTTGTTWRGDMAIDAISLGAATTKTFTDSNVLSSQAAVAEYRAEFAKTIHLFPNPSNGQFTVQFEGQASISGDLRILGVFGKVIEVHRLDLTKGQNEYQLNLGHLVEGTYLLEINDGQETHLERFVIVR